MTLKMIKKSEFFPSHCLFFTANSLSRTITRIAEEEFKMTGMSPSHAYIMMLLYDKNCLTPSKLAKKLNLSPSTVTRLIDSLEREENICRNSNGKKTEIRLTNKGYSLKTRISHAWQRFYNKYTDILGVSEGKELTDALRSATEKLLNDTSKNDTNRRNLNETKN